MAEVKQSRPASAFSAAGLNQAVADLIAEIQKLYAEDEIPWVVGYSGGKDSTATLQLVWMALQELAPEKRKKQVFVITTDTLVENPVISAWVTRSLKTMEKAATEQGLPIFPNQLTPDVRDTFWVNLIGKGYPAPSPKFRWCTERLKIKPSDAFIGSVVQQNGEAIVVLGTRKAESSARAGRMNALEKMRMRDNLNPHSSLPNAYVYAPVADWSNDDIWLFLMQKKNPWGYSNKDLLTIYQGASEDSECPLVLDTSTPSCGDSRFGCWVCTLVEQDKSMSAMIRNDDDKVWMHPMLQLRNELDARDHDKRDFRRLNGAVQLIGNTESLVPGPYTQVSREDWLRKLLRIQETVRANPKSPPEAKELELITINELHEIRRIWVVEKYEIEDRVPAIFLEETGRPFPSRPIDESQPFGPEEMALLKEACAGDEVQFGMLRELLEVERRFRGMARRSRLFERLEGAFRRGFYEDAEDASTRAISRRNLAEKVKNVREKDLDFGELRETINELVNPTTVNSPAQN